jgi:hypothetical protein
MAEDADGPGQAAVTAAGPDRRRVKLSRLAVLVLGCVTVAIIAATVPLSVLARQQPLEGASVGLLLGVPFAGVGVVVARRQPGNLIGWLSLAFALLFLLSNDAGSYLVAEYRLGRHLPLGPVMLFVQPLWIPALAILPLIVLMFPEGRLPSPRWRLALAGYAVLVAGFLTTECAQATAAIGHRIRVDSTGDLIGAAHHSGPTALAGVLVFLALFVFALSCVARQALSWRRSSGERRQQLKWLMSGGVVTVTSLLASVVIGNAPGIYRVLSDVLAFGLVAIPLAIGVGISKYRLYDIDRLISRTLAYAIVTGLLIGVYAGLVLLATEALPVSLSTPVAVACATLVAAALFNPLRRRVQHAVDRRFNRARYDADQMVAAFADRLKDAVDLDSVRDDLAGVVRKALEPVHVSLWTSHGDGGGTR